MSSSRVHTTFTGPSTCCPMRTACVTQSYSSRRPNPPPSRWLCTTTFSSGWPATPAAVPWPRGRGCEPAPQHGARGHGGDLHPRQPHVDAVLRLAVHFVRRVQPLRRCADQCEVLGILERDFLRHRHFGRLFGQRAVAEGTAGRRVCYYASFCPA